jgi:tRNA-binding EMAP/Myf-like protein
VIDSLDIRFGKVCEIKPFSAKPDSPRRKYCIIKVEFPELGVVKQSVGQFAHHKNDMEGRTVLCLTNLGVRNMFGQPSEILILGVPHPDGGIIPGDTHEAQATYLQAIAPESVCASNDIKPVASYDDWSAADIRLVEVVGQTECALEVKLNDELMTVPLAAPLTTHLVGRNTIVVRDGTQQSRGLLPMTVQGAPLLAEPRENVRVGAKVY